MSEPIQLEWEPAEWPYDDASVEQYPARTKGWMDAVEAVVNGECIRVRVYPGVSPRKVSRNMHTARCRSVNPNVRSAKIETRRSGDYVYVRRVE